MDKFFRSGFILLQILCTISKIQFFYTFILEPKSGIFKGVSN